MTTAPDTAQESTLYGPDGRALYRPATTPATRTPSPGEHEAELAGRDSRIAELEQRLAIEAAKDRHPLPTPNPVPAPPAPVPAAETEPKKPWFDRNGPKIAMYAAVGLSASGEYALARLAGFDGYVAGLLPIAMDVYVIQAMRRHRDVAAALILAVAANALDRLAEARLFGVDHNGAATWWLIVAVVAIAPLIVWRVHRITETKSKTETSRSRSRETTKTPQSRDTETSETTRTETSETTVSPRSHETTGETETTKTLVSPRLRETSAETTPETRTPQEETRETETTETKTETRSPRTPRPRKTRETATPTVTAIGDPETETTGLLDLMKSRGGALTVSLDEAITETGRPKSTAAKRLAAARKLYAQSA